MAKSPCKPCWIHPCRRTPASGTRRQPLSHELQTRVPAEEQPLVAVLRVRVRVQVQAQARVQVRVQVRARVQVQVRAQQVWHLLP